MALNLLTSTLEIDLKWNAQKNITGRNPLLQTDTLRHAQNNGTANANNASGGADELVSYNLTIAANTAATVDVTALTDILQISVNLARIKSFMFHVISYTEDATLGTNCTSITIGNAAANQQNLNLGTNSTITVAGGGTWGYASPKAAGILASGSAKNIKINNDDVTNAATVQISIVGGLS